MNPRKVIVELALNRHLVLECYAPYGIFNLYALFVVLDNEAHFALILGRYIDAAVFYLVSIGNRVNFTRLKLT
jgi:hypothetical protein